MVVPAATTVVVAAALLVLELWLADAQVWDAGLPAGCPASDRCGDVSVPYPFGIRAGCYLPGFGLTCDATRNPPRLRLGNGTLQVVEISLANFTVRVLDFAGAVNISYGESTTMPPSGNGTWASLGAGADAGPYVVSDKRNQLVVTGCNVQATLTGDSGNIITGCSSFCPVSEAFTAIVIPAKDLACSGTRCCETPMVIGRPSYLVRFNSLDPNQEMDNKLPMAVRIAEQGWFDKHATELLDNSTTAMVTSPRTPVPVVLEWALASTLMVVLQGVSGRPAGNDGPWSCPRDAARSACRSSNSFCLNVTSNYRSGHVCQCAPGYDGNPYLADAGGCHDIDECALPGTACFGVCINTPGSFLCQCPRGASGNPRIPGGCVKSNLGLSVGIGIGSGAGLLVLALGAIFLTRKIKHRRARMVRQKFFKQNRGHLLQQLVSQKADIAERMIIPLAELEKATNNFDESRELGGGGHGTVYKGILTDLHVVAIKKSKVAIQREIDEFINEVAILSQINHRNVVKLFGCCLETEVPLLVYEFISNGTLYHHLHVEGPVSLPWEDRLRIAAETSRALAYLHSAVSFPIIHRDIKCHNILLEITALLGLTYSTNKS
ncbi:hypothetical protein GUJ93_ZPchr0009g2280 [Zizania palustris]|uniref:Protein kinase domain-containing protein n=1 Tax=Zizania palustris TaxID=103762 RepID=A0A8J5RN10_ZIZPA|nr:hypothetical protein GUJ93_ZPchr0009g2280 [Zizania palustris]